MIGFELFLALSVVGVDYGWQTNDQGKLEYIIQIEPELLNSLREGREIISFIDPQVRGVRCFRVRVGDTPPPRVTTINESQPQGPAGVAPIPSPETMDSSRDNLAPLAGGSSADAPNLIDSAVLPQKRAAELRPSILREQLLQPPENPPSVYSNPSQDIISDDQAPRIIAEPAPPIYSDPEESTAPPALMLDDPGKEFSIETPPPIPLPPAEAFVNPVSPERETPPPTIDQEVVRTIHERSAGLQNHTKESEPEFTSAGEESPDDAGLMFPAGQDQPSNKPWLFVTVLLFASLGGNAYLGWICTGVYRRYRKLAIETARNRATSNV